VPQPTTLGREPRHPDGQLVTDQDGLGRSIVRTRGKHQRLTPSGLHALHDAGGLLGVGLPPGRPERIDEEGPVARLAEPALDARHALEPVLRLDDALVGGDREIEGVRDGLRRLLRPRQRGRDEEH
jgi:hypothetical protein